MIVHNVLDVLLGQADPCRKMPSFQTYTEARMASSGEWSLYHTHGACVQAQGHTAHVISHAPCSWHARQDSLVRFKCNLHCVASRQVRSRICFHGHIDKVDMTTALFVPSADQVISCVYMYRMSARPIAQSFWRMHA